MKFLRDSTIHELEKDNRRLALQNQELETEKDELGRKHKSKAKNLNGAIKEEKHQESDKGRQRRVPHQSDPVESEFRYPLRPYRSPCTVNERDCGTSIVTWVGNPWELGGDALIVTTDESLQILNTNFRLKLQQHFGGKYQGELRQAVKDRRKSLAALVVTSGGLTHYHSIINVPVGNIKPGEELSYYRDKLFRSRWTVICTDAIRPDDLDWREAERITYTVEKYMYGIKLTEEVPCEIVQVTLPEQ